jgi:hypothetical protein
MRCPEGCSMGVIIPLLNHKCRIIIFDYYGVAANQVEKVSSASASASASSVGCKDESNDVS